MGTVASRKFRSVPYRDAGGTWEAIVKLLTAGKKNDGDEELRAVSGIASSVIADKAAEDAPIVVTSDGPRTRIYCIYDDDSLDSSAAAEEALGYDALKGDWRISLPCAKEDLKWVQDALKAKSTRVSARDKDEAMVEKAGAGKATSLILDPAGFKEL